MHLTQSDAKHAFHVFVEQELCWTLRDQLLHQPSTATFNPLNHHLALMFSALLLFPERYGIISMKSVLGSLSLLRHTLFLMLS